MASTLPALISLMIPYDVLYLKTQARLVIFCVACIFSKFSKDMWCTVRRLPVGLALGCIFEEIKNVQNGAST